MERHVDARKWYCCFASLEDNGGGENAVVLVRVLPDKCGECIGKTPGFRLWRFCFVEDTLQAVECAKVTRAYVLLVTDVAINYLQEPAGRPGQRHDQVFQGIFAKACIMYVNLGQVCGRCGRT